MKLFRKMKERIRKQREKGVALFIALVALLLMAAIATGMMFMANTESAINYNYRDAQFTYFAAGAGLEDAPDDLVGDSAGAQRSPFQGGASPSGCNGQHEARTQGALVSIPDTGATEDAASGGPARSGGSGFILNGAPLAAPA